MLTRRQFLGAAAAAPLVFHPPSLRAAIGRFPSSRAFLIERIDRTTVRVPYREAPRRAMNRELPHWRYSEIVQVKLKSGHVGIGETLIWYTWGRTTDEAVKRAMGKNAAFQSRGP